MGNGLSGRTCTTPAIRKAIQNSQESVQTLAARYGVNRKTITKWRRRHSVNDEKKGPKNPKSTVLSIAEEALIAAFRLHSLLPLDDCLTALLATIPHLSRSSLHRCLKRHDISRAPAKSGAPEAGTDFVGCFHIGITELPLPKGKSHLFLAFDHASKMAFAELHEEVTASTASAFLHSLIATMPYRVEAIVAGGDAPFVGSTGRNTLSGKPVFETVCATNGIAHRFAGPDQLWNDEQMERVNRTVHSAVEHAGDAVELSHARHQLLEFIAAFNLSCKLNVLNGLTPYEYVSTLRAKEQAGSFQFQSTNSWDKLVPDPGSAVRKPSGARQRRSKSATVTREAILEAARGRLAYDGPEGLSMSEVARIAGVNRGTAYQHFETREKLIKATSEWVSGKLYRAVFGDPETVRDRPVETIDPAELIDRLAHFAMDNPELCRGWLLQVLSSEDPASDIFWREYQGSTARFAKTKGASENVDTEVLSVIMLAGAFLWPVWARTKAGKDRSLAPLAHRFAQESLRISMHGTLRSEHYPAIAKRLKADPD